VPHPNVGRAGRLLTVERPTSRKKREKWGSPSLGCQKWDTPVRGPSLETDLQAILENPDNPETSLHLSRIGTG